MLDFSAIKGKTEITAVIRTADSSIFQVVLPTRTYNIAACFHLVRANPDEWELIGLEELSPDQRIEIDTLRNYLYRKYETNHKSKRK